MEAAAKQFAAHGFEGASLNRILEEAEISKGAAYYYFDDKADVFLTAVQHYAQQLMAVTDLDVEGLTAETFWPSFADAYRAQFVRAFDQPWKFGVLKAAARLSEGALAYEALAEYADQMRDWGLGILKRGQSVDVVRTDLPDDLMLGLVTAIDDAGDGWLLQHWNELELAEIEDVANRVADAMRRLLAPLE
jgi:AcrR family transcriptional regulator